MDTIRLCKRCGQPLPENAPEGLCPACLAKVALGSEPVNPKTRVPPDVTQLAAQFPQLEIIELLGMGGMGMVYKARQPRLDRFVALKILPVASLPDVSFAERFEREAKALAKLNHPGIVTLHDFGQTRDYYYFIMEYVDGMNLRQFIRSQPLDPRQALELVIQICTALQFAHDEKIVHRDIKPENILLTKKGQVKIADFGLAKLLGAAPDTSLTASQMVMGTLNYMAPEQRENSKDVDHRADIYSLGVVFYEMLTGQVPLGRFEPPSKKVQVDVRLDEVVLHALEREPARRYQHVSEVKTNVENITAASPVAPAAAALLGKPVPSRPHLSRTALTGAACLVLFVGLFVYSLVFDLYTMPQEHRESVPTSVDAQGHAISSRDITVPGPPTSWRVAVLILVVLGIAAAFGTTVCGWVAVAQIQRSSEALYGLRLAVFDGLVFPLLLADVAVLLLVLMCTPMLYGLASLVLRIPPPPPNSVISPVPAFALAGLISVGLDYLLARKVCRFCLR